MHNCKHYPASQYCLTVCSALGDGHCQLPAEWAAQRAPWHQAEAYDAAWDPGLLAAGVQQPASSRQQPANGAQRARWATSGTRALLFLYGAGPREKNGSSRKSSEAGLGSRGGCGTPHMALHTLVCSSFCESLRYGPPTMPVQHICSISLAKTNYS